MSPILGVIIALIVVGAILYLLKFLPIDETFKQIIKVLAIVGVVIYAIVALWSLVGGGGPGLPLGR